MAGKQSEYKLAIQIAGMVDQSLGASCNLTKKQLREIAKEAANANKSSVSFSDAMEKAGPGIDASWGGLKKTVLTTVEAMAAAGAAVAAVGIASVGVGKEFESAMSSWAATATASEEDYKRAREAALEMGRTTSKTATESAAALEYMALAGWSVDKSIAGLPGILRLSEATGLDLARTSDLVTDSMSALGIEVDELSGYLDIAAMANNKSNQTAEQLMEAYIGVGGTLNNLNVPLKESGTALGVLANRGIKGSEAGNALNAVMINLTTGTGQAGKMMKKLKISAFDSEGNFKGLKSTLETVNSALSGLTEEQRNAALAAIGGKQHVDAMNDLLSGLNTTVADGVTEWDKLAGELGNAGGALETMAATKLDNLDGDLAILQSALQDTGIKIYDNLREPLRDAVQFGTGLVYDFSKDIGDGLQAGLPTIKRVMGEAADAVGEFAEPVLEIGGWILDNSDLVAGGLVAIGTTITTLKLVKTITDTTSAMNALKLAMMSNPVTAAIGIAALAGGAIAGISTKVKLANAEMKRQDLASRFGDITLSMGELEDVAKQIVGEKDIENLAAAMEEIGKVKGIAENIDEATKSLDKFSWKIGMGMELDESELAGFSDSIDSIINGSLQLVEQAQYTANVNVKTLFGEGDANGQEILNGFNSMYESINKEVEEEGRRLGEIYNQAMEDGIIGEDESKLINEQIAKLRRLTDAVAEYQMEANLESLKIKFSGKDLDAESFQNLQSEIQEWVNEATGDNQESIAYQLANLNMQFDRSQQGLIKPGDAAYLSEKAYEEARTAIEEAGEQKQREIELKAFDFTMGTINDSYADITGQMDDFVGTIEDYLANSISEDADAWRLNTSEQYIKAIQDIKESPEISQASRDAIGEILEGIQPQVEQWQKIAADYESNGMRVPEAIRKGLNDVALLQAILGDEGKITSMMDDYLGSSPEAVALLGQAEELGNWIPETISDGIESGKSSIDPGIDSLYQYAQEQIRSKLGTMEVETSVDLIVSSINRSAVSKSAKSTSSIPRYAEGGIFDTPHFGLFAEDGPEAIVPLNRSANAISIWQKAGEALGVYGSTSDVTSAVTSSVYQQDNSSSGIIYSPTYQIYGSDEQTIRKATEDDYEKFAVFMERYGKRERRLNMMDVQRG